MHKHDSEPLHYLHEGTIGSGYIDKEEETMSDKPRLTKLLNRLREMNLELDSDPDFNFDFDCAPELRLNQVDKGMCELIDAIEELGASEELTRVVILATEQYRRIQRMKVKYLQLQEEIIAR